MKFLREAQQSAQHASRLKIGGMTSFEDYYDLGSQPSKVDLSELEYFESMKQNNLNIEESALV